MRTKIILPVSILALAMVGSAVYFRYFYSERPPLPFQAVVADADTNTGPALPVILHQTASASAQASSGNDVPTQADTPPSDTNSPEYEAYVAKSEADLAQLGESHDPGAFHTILNQLNSKDPDIRRSAVDATMDFGDSNAIPTLRNEMAWTEDPEEKVKIENAIKFLEMPTLTVDAYGQIVK